MLGQSGGLREPTQAGPSVNGGVEQLEVEMKMAKLGCKAQLQEMVQNEESTTSTNPRRIFFKRAPLYYISSTLGSSCGSDSYFESQTVQTSECKRSCDYKEATANADALLQKLNTRPAR